jgi:hypothetical protein
MWQSTPGPGVARAAARDTRRPLPGDFADRVRHDFCIRCLQVYGPRYNASTCPGANTSAFHGLCSPMPPGQASRPRCARRCVQGVRLTACGVRRSASASRLTAQRHQHVHGGEQRRGVARRSGRLSGSTLSPPPFFSLPFVPNAMPPLPSSVQSHGGTREALLSC